MPDYVDALGVGRTLGSDVNTDVSFHQGVIAQWDSTNFTNQITVQGTTINNVPVLTSAGIVGLRVGDPIAVMQYKTTYFILGRIVTQTSQLSEPLFPIVLYPLFQSSVALGASGYAQLAAGTLSSWEGRVRVVHPKIEVDGIWGQASGSNTAIYDLKLGGEAVGEWTVSGALEVARHGPFDVTRFIGQDWLKIEIVLVASSGTGQVAFQPLGAYFRQT